MLSLPAKRAPLALFLALATAAQAETPASRFVEVDGVSMHYLEAGEGDPILLLHGNPTSVNRHAILTP